jgi:hypothetical protein
VTISPNKKSKLPKTKEPGMETLMVQIEQDYDKDLSKSKKKTKGKKAKKPVKGDSSTMEVLDM